MLYEGDEVSLFGVLSYDTKTGQASIDETVAMMATRAKDAIISCLNWDYFWDCTNIGFKALVGSFCLLGFVACCQLVKERMRNNRLESDAVALAEQDQQNQIQGAPPKVRFLPADLQNNQVQIDNPKCARCAQHRANIVMIPCLHCSLCEECFKKLPNKTICDKC